MSEATDTCPTCQQPWPGAKDGRARPWRVRIRLYKVDNEEPEADTDPDAAPGAPGSMILNGLPDVAAELERTATAFHAAPCAGLSEEALRHRLKALRPTLSRRKGNGAWRVPYVVAGVGWVARVDVERVAEVVSP